MRGVLNLPGSVDGFHLAAGSSDLSVIYGKKSLEGSMAMFNVSFLSILAIYRYHSALSQWWMIALVAFGVALFSTIAELISKRGTDTFFCPASALAGFAILMVNAGMI